MIYTNFAEIPKNKYNIIYADCPWEYEDTLKGAANHYDVMTIHDIRALPVQSIAKDDALLFMWCTFPMLEEGLDVINAWGFQYVTNGFTWIKKNKSHGYFIGLGHYTRSNAEVCLIGKRGKGLKVINHSISQIHSSIVREHSVKPDAIRQKIVKMVGDQPRIELFARIHAQGWDSFGNEIRESYFEGGGD